MSVIATAVKHLLAAGVTGDALVTAIAEMEQALSPADTRSTGAKRTARWREIKRHEASQNVTCDAPIPPLKDAPHTPQENNPPHTSLRSVSFEREHAEFLDWAWREIPKRRGDSPKPFRKALLRAIRDGARLETIRVGLVAYANSEKSADPQFRKGAAVWVNAAGWEADYASQPRAGPAPRDDGKSGWANLARKIHERQKTFGDSGDVLGLPELPDGRGSGGLDDGIIPGRFERLF